MVLNVSQNVNHVRCSYILTNNIYKNGESEYDGCRIKKKIAMNERKNVVNELKDDYGNCEGEGGCNNCLFSMHGEIECMLNNLIEKE